MNANQCNYRVQYARDHYPHGTRVRLLNMPDDPQPILPGTTGTVMGVDDAGQLLMKWDNGRALSLLPGTDSFEVISRPKAKDVQRHKGEARLTTVQNRRIRSFATRWRAPKLPCVFRDRRQSPLPSLWLQCFRIRKRPTAKPGWSAC